MPVLPFMDTIAESLGVDAVADTLIDVSPVEETAEQPLHDLTDPDDSDDLLQLLQEPVVVDEPPVVARDRVDEAAPSVASTEPCSTDSDVESDVDVEATPNDDHDPRFQRMNRQWWNGTQGVIDVRPWGPGADATSGKVFDYCSYTIGRLVGSAGGPGTITYKVGVAKDVFRRFDDYVTRDDKPFSHMFVLHRTSTREGAHYLESGLINRNWCIPHFVNKERRDRGGTGNADGCVSGCFVYVIAYRHVGP